MDLDPNGIKNLFYAAIAAIGGALGYLYREVRASRTIQITRLLLSSCLAAFIGYHMVFIYQSLGFDPKIIGALNGLTALLGVEFTLFLIERWVLQKFGIKPDDKLAHALVAAGWTPPTSFEHDCKLSLQEQQEAKKHSRDSEDNAS